jgi:SAM-dependent methyltransferase
MSDNAGYWETTGATKDFTHPLDTAWLSGVPAGAPILDYGCGYGRLMSRLSHEGFTDVAGADTSAALIARGRRARPVFRFTLIDEPPTVPFPAGSFQVVLLFAVLTCVPGDEDQRALVAEVDRVLAPGGLLYVSDLLMQSDQRSLDRYAPDGTFTTDDGATVRHHDLATLRDRLAGFEPVQERELTVATLNGHHARAAQLLVRKR